MIFDNKITPRFFRAIFGKTSDNNYEPIVADKSTCGLLTARHNEEAVHDGRFFRSGLNYTLANSNVADFGMTIPNDSKEIHMSWALLH